MKIKSKSLVNYLVSLTSFLMVLFTSLATIQLQADKTDSLIFGFGSCANQNNEQLIWNKIAEHKPALFILAGDNVYIDSAKVSKMAESYKTLAANPNFSTFRQSVPLIGIWDDHDYGMPDGGKNFVAKKEAKEAFIDFFNYPEVNELKGKDRGLYHSRWLDFNDKKIQIIILDTRWYRDPLLRTYLSTKQRKQLNLGHYQPILDTSTTMLGQEQWNWLEEELKKPADMRFIVSSIQVLNEFSGWETWANFPHERQKLLSLMHRYSDDNIMLLSGDIHKAEISQLEYNDKIFVEVTSSGLDEYIHKPSENSHRVGDTLEEMNYAMVKISDNGKLSAVATIYNDQGIKKLVASIGAKK